jgi:hypothetical protein
MRPLICPQCGGQIDEYATGAAFTVCEYCGTKFLVEENKVPRVPPVVDAPALETDPEPQFVKILGISLAAIAGIVLVAVLASKPSKGIVPTTPFVSKAATPTPVATPTPDPALLRFGGLVDATSIAVDTEGRIYVADNKLRVQQFDAAGNVLKRLDVPAKGTVYERAHVVYKVAVGSDGRLFVAVGGAILVYGENWNAKPRTLHDAPNYIQDFVVRPDGSLLAISDNDEIEALLFFSKSGAITRRVQGFHTDALNATATPLETAIELVRIAADSKGDIFSIYALNAAHSYSLSYNDEDLRIVRSTPNAKFGKAFVGPGKVAAMVFDANDRLLVSDGTNITAYDLDGNNIASRPAGPMNTFTVDKDGNIYTISDDAVAKFPRVQ